jgi:hypothetical protein
MSIKVQSKAGVITRFDKNFLTYSFGKFTAVILVGPLSSNSFIIAGDNCFRLNLPFPNYP